MSKVTPNQHLFVYGTLAPGRLNARVLADVPGTWTEGSVAGRLVQHGWGAALGYPALELTRDGSRVDGFLFTSSALAEHWSRLDAFEGEAYARVVAHIRLPDGRQVPAYLYVARAYDSQQN